MAKRVVGKNRGSVYAGGRVFLEGQEIPDDVQVDDVVFTDADDPSGNTPVGPTVVSGVAASSAETEEPPARRSSSRSAG